MFKFLLVYITLWSIENCETTSLPETLSDIYVGCYGTHVFQPYCVSSDTVIAVRNTWVGSKFVSSGCPPAAEMVNGLFLVDAANDSILVNETECCSPNYDTDCISTKVDDDYVYQVRCTGLTNCSRATAVFWEQTNSNSCPSQGPHLDDTNYMFMEYYCIPRSSITPFTDNVATQIYTKPHYVQNPGYPSYVTSGPSSTTCSVTSDSCGISIYIYTIDIRLVSSSGICQQSLSIKVGNLTFFTWECDNQTYFNITNQTVPSNHVTVKFSNHATVNGGNFWIGFRASDNSNLRLNCPGEPAQPASTCEPIQPEESKGNVIPIIIGAVVGFLVLALVLVCLVWYCCFRKRKPVTDSKGVNQNSVENNEDPSHTVSETLIGTGYNGVLSSAPPIQHGLHVRVPSPSEQYGRLPPLVLKGETIKKDKQMKNEMTVGRNNDVNVLLPNQTMPFANNQHTIKGATKVPLTHVTEDMSSV